jgi:LSD1 subclass zinc finger protein
MSEEAAPAAAAGERPGMGRKRNSRRRLSRGGSQRGSLGSTSEAAKTVSLEFGEDEPVSNLPGVGSEEDQGTTRQNSWYQDALAQGGGELANMLGEVQDAAQQVAGHSDDDEVLEQYRIMAQLEASIRVKENTGFDMAEYEKRRKLNPEPVQKGDYIKKYKPKLPEMKQVGLSSNSIAPKDPPMPPKALNRKFIDQRMIRVPELMPGGIMRGSGAPPPGELTVRCLGCRTNLHVNLLATMVNCSECGTVSPASSTRR